ncbi:hypothetical protein [Geobacter sp. DSM 9736]|uniref:hypothetical protein n=1 Tax=Geobacter sp. DSM 9736 TaxID=1277350 RepID=UPI000B513818|nr:hypothetical protein [Geobacter sp. DSM 9736]SNB46559.1 hypothetical protein SAMN06269301_2027 [Geobacter sp. DSM 9736]
MRERDYDRICYITEQREESVALRNLRSGEVGYSFGCTYEGGTVQVRLNDGGLDSWTREECREVDFSVGTH